MLCPETWNFEPPPHCISVDTVDYMKPDVPAVVKNHYFNHSISIVLPDFCVSESLHECLEDSDYYRINKLRVSDLINTEFIEAFVKRGEISLLTIDNKIDLQNSICLTPTGCLILSLLTDDYQALGLEGEPSAFSHKPHTRYIVRIDLTSKSFIPGKKNYERVRTALEERLKQTFDVIVSWDPPAVNVCPSSIAAWFCARNYDVYLCRHKFSKNTKISCSIPSYKDRRDKTVDFDFFEWLGVFSIDGDNLFEEEENNDDACAHKYRCPSPLEYVDSIQHLQWTGFFTRKKIQEVYDMLKQYVSEIILSFTWVSLDIQGFADSLVSFDLKEHMFFTDGDNSYTIVFLPHGDAVIRRSLSSNNKKNTKKKNTTNKINR